MRRTVFAMFINHQARLQTQLRKRSRLASNLPEKLKLEKDRRQLETKRDAAWRAYEQEAKVIENKKDGLIDEIEKKLKPRINEETLFMIRWEVV